MDKATDFSLSQIKLTRAAFLWTSILRAPFWAIYTILLMILYKDLHATPFQIALFIALKPVVSIFSVYWSSYIHQRPDRLLSNIVWAGVIGYVPFLLFPFFSGPWFVLFASALYMMTLRGVVPAWMEVFKLNLPDGVKEKVFSYGSIVSYVIGAILPLIIGPLLDKYPFCWRWIFCFTAVLSMGAILLQLKIPIPEQKKFPSNSPLQPFFKHLLDPWQNAWKLLASRPDFRSYQIGFMIFGGCGLMVIQPALPQFFIDRLGLSYTELSIALSLCKGIGFALTSPLWAGRMPKVDLYRFSSSVTFLGALFPLILMAAQIQVFWIYVAYFIYGIMQAGSEMSWHLSGPLFSKKEDSSQFSSVNVLTVGIRGSIVPQIGSLLCFFSSSPWILLLGSVSCLLGALWLNLVKQPLLTSKSNY